MRRRTLEAPGSVPRPRRSAWLLAAGLGILLMQWPALSAASSRLLGAGETREDPRREALRIELARAWPPVSRACLERALTGDLPGATEWSTLRSLAWPARDGPRVSLWDRLEAEIDGRGARALCIHPREPAAFALRVPDAWKVRSGRDWLLARAPEGDLALEAVAFPSVYSPAALAKRSLSLLQRSRRVQIRVQERRDSEIGGRGAFRVVWQQRVKGRDVRVRATWVRLGSRVVRLMGVAEIAAEWREPGLLERIESSLRPRAESASARVAR